MYFADMAFLLSAVLTLFYYILAKMSWEGYVCNIIKILSSPFFKSANILVPKGGPLYEYKLQGIDLIKEFPLQSNASNMHKKCLESNIVKKYQKICIFMKFYIFPRIVLVKK